MKIKNKCGNEEWSPHLHGVRWPFQHWFLPVNLAYTLRMRLCMRFSYNSYAQKTLKMGASLGNLKGKICGSDDIPLGCLIVRCLFIIEIIRGWYSWVVTQTRRQLIFLLSTENCGFRMLMWTPIYSMIIPIMWRYLSNNSHTNEMKVDQTRFHAVHFHLSHSTIRLPKVININKLSRFPLFWET